TNLQHLGDGGGSQVVEIPAQRTAAMSAHRHSVQSSAMALLSQCLQEPAERRRVIDRLQGTIARKCRQAGEHRHTVKIVDERSRSLPPKRLLRNEIER